MLLELLSLEEPLAALVQVLLVQGAFLVLEGHHLVAGPCLGLPFVRLEVLLLSLGGGVFKSILLPADSQSSLRSLLVVYAPVEANILDDARSQLLGKIL